MKVSSSHAIIWMRADDLDGELQHDLGHRPSILSGIFDRLESRGLIRRALNIPQPSLCLDVACEDVGVGLWSRDGLAMTRL
jgi:hypothetical protein